MPEDLNCFGCFMLFSAHITTLPTLTPSCFIAYQVAVMLAELEVHRL